MEATKNILTADEQVADLLKKFAKAKNKIEAVVYLKEYLIILQKEKGDDPRIAKFLEIIQTELNFELGQTNWKKIEIEIDCPEIGHHKQSINKSLFMKEELKASNVYAPDSSLMSKWDYLNKKVTMTYRKYRNLYIQLQVA